MPTLSKVRRLSPQSQPLPFPLRLNLFPPHQAWLASLTVCPSAFSVAAADMKKNPQYKLPEPIHVALLRQQAAYPKVIDFSFLLKELRLHGALRHLTPNQTLGLSAGGEAVQAAAQTLLARFGMS